MDDAGQMEGDRWQLEGEGGEKRETHGTVCKSNKGRRRTRAPRRERNQKSKKSGDMCRFRGRSIRWSHGSVSAYDGARRRRTLAGSEYESGEGEARRILGRSRSQ